MTPRPLVSVVLPTRDRASRVAAAIASVQGQTHRNLEILVVDDGSTDGTREVLDGIATTDGRVRVLRQDVARGAPTARNRALDEATGEFVAFLDDDDRWAATKIERQLRHLAGHPRQVGVSCWRRIVREGSPEVPHVHRTLGCAGRGLCWFNFPGGFSFVMLRRDGVAGDLRLDEGMPACQDWEYWIRCADRGPIGVVPEVLCDFHVHDGPRISTRSRERSGREALLARHCARMTPTCLAYQAAHLEMLEGGGGERLRRVGAALVEGRSASAAAIVGVEWLGSSMGKLTRRPGLVDRTLARAARVPVPEGVSA